MRVGIIGLGDIAQKAYLPVLSQTEGIELILCTRNQDTLNHLAEKYRIEEKVQSIDELVKKNIDAALVSTATEAHFSIAEELLQHGIHVYIDKPISVNLTETKQIVNLSKEVGKIAMVGFNRRFIPKVRELKEHGDPDLIIMQKNRFDALEYPRRFIVEDFIHVVDTLRFLMDQRLTDLKINFLKQGDLLDKVVIQLIGEDCIAIGIMNRNGGVTEELIEYNTKGHKYVVDNLVHTTHYHQNEINLSKFGDWVPTLKKRGFHDMLDHFIDCIQNNKQPNPSIEDSLITHEICEKIVQYIESEI